MMIFFFCLFSYGPIKLLALAEIANDFSAVPGFWAVFFTNTFFCIVAAVIWVVIVAKFEPFHISENVWRDEEANKLFDKSERYDFIYWWNI